MPLYFDDAEADCPANDTEALGRLEDILLQVAEGARHDALNAEYKKIRHALFSDATYRELIPDFVRRHRDLRSMWSAFKDFSPQWEPRRQEVRRQFSPLLNEAERLALDQSNSNNSNTASDPRFDSSAWTGASSPSERIVAVRTLLPIAREAIEQLLELLEKPSHNGGPRLDEIDSAIQQLRCLHSTLGTLLDAADEGQLVMAFNQGLAADAARFAIRAARELRNDPLPYAISGTVLALLSACGIPTIAGYLAGVALQMKKR